MSNLEIVGLGALNMDDIYQVDRITGDKEGAVNTKNQPESLWANSPAAQPPILSTA